MLVLVLVTDVSWFVLLEMPRASTRRIPRLKERQASSLEKPRSTSAPPHRLPTRRLNDKLFHMSEAQDLVMVIYLPISPKLSSHHITHLQVPLLMSRVQY